MDIDQIADALDTGDGRVIAGVVLLIIVWAAKRWTPDSWLKNTTEKRVFAGAIAGIPSVALAISSHASAHALLVTAATAFGLATGFHHLVDVGSGSTPNIPPPPKRPLDLVPPAGDAPTDPPAAARWFDVLRAELRLRGLVMWTAIALTLVGCARPLDTAVVTVNGTKEAIVEAHDQLRDGELDEVRRAVDGAADRATAEAATAAIEARYAKRWFLYDDVRDAWIAARATVDEAQSLEAAHMNVDMGDVVTAVAVLGQAWGRLGAEIAAQVKAKGASK